MFKFGNSILKTEYIKKECFRKEIMISTILSLIVIGLIIALAVLFSNIKTNKTENSGVVVLSENIESIYGEWKPGKMFIGNTILGSAQSLSLDDKTLTLGKIEYEIDSVNHEITLPNGTVVFIIKTKKDHEDQKETTEFIENQDGAEATESIKAAKSYPFIMINKNEAILQLSNGNKKIGMSYSR